jgi:hypothetical protein
MSLTGSQLSSALSPGSLSLSLSPPLASAFFDRLAVFLSRGFSLFLLSASGFSPSPSLPSTLESDPPPCP